MSAGVIGRKTIEALASAEDVGAFMVPPRGLAPEADRGGAGTTFASRRSTYRTNATRLSNYNSV
jgi:hypothetical protein